MSSYFHSDPWYTSSKATLRPLTYYSEEGFEVENNHLCGRVNQLATDCISEAKDKGFSPDQISRGCERRVTTSLICQTRILCPVELHTFLFKCQTKRAHSYNDPDCQVALGSLEVCASRMNIPHWWMNSSVHAVGSEDLDRANIRHMKATNRNVGSYLDKV